jgi:hypothetical protein
MPARSTSGSARRGRRFRIRLALTTAVSLLAVGAPAAAASAATVATPTLTAPTVRTGYGTVTLSGTARAGSRVTLYETAISINHLAPADDWEHGGGVLHVTADRHGRWRIVRYVDTGFLFAVKADGRMSAKRRVQVKVLPTIELTSPGSGLVQVHVEASPNEAGLTVRVQRPVSAGRWVTVATGRTDAVGAYDHRLSGQTAGNHQFRALIVGDPGNGVLANHSGGAYVRVSGT